MSQKRSTQNAKSKGIIAMDHSYERFEHWPPMVMDAMQQYTVVCSVCEALLRGLPDMCKQACS